MFTIPEELWQDSIRKVNEAHNSARAELEGATTEHLEGYVRAYEDAGILHRIPRIWGSLAPSHVKYDEAKSMLLKRELEAMDDEQLLTVSEELVGFFASGTRQRTAYEILDRRTAPSLV